ncbi:MAG: WcbI family polysaccharide biosynthesis putative acetyltransferase [Pseudomonadota bacterium]
MKKVLVIGNCQARPVASILEKLALDVELLDPIILHLSKADDAPEQEALINTADIVFAQYTADIFQPAHLRSSFLKQENPGKVLIWPNIFYAGQQPSLRYITHASGGRIAGPLDTYHDLRILEKWYNANDLDLPFQKTSDDQIHQHSLAELRAREEAACDVGISDLIEDKFRQERLFFTFNHPSLALLSVVTSRLIDACGLQPSTEELVMKEPLARIIPPSLWEDDDLEAQTFRGPRIDFETPNLALPGPPTDYSYQDMLSLFYRSYEQQKDKLLDTDNLRVTPNYRH